MCGGLRTSNNPQRLMDPVLAYLGLQFQATNEFFSRSAQSNDSLGRFLVSNSTGAHSHVDMCLYIIDGQLWPVDIQYMKRLSGLVNLVPVLVPAEGRAPGQVRLDRLELMHYLRDNKIDIYGMDIDEVDHGEGHEAINNDDNAAGDRGPACREAFQAPDPLTSVPLTPFLSPPFVLYLSPSRSSPASFASESVAATTNHSTQDNIDEKISQLNIPPAYPSSPGSMAVDHSLLDLWNSQQMHIVRDWMLITHLAALRYHTTRKFLEWRQQLPWMALSDSFYSQYQSSGNRSGPFGATGDVSYSSGKDSKSGTSSEGGYQPDVQVSPHANQHVYRLPSEHMAHVQARNQQRISESVTKILETDAIVLRRIIRERQEAWRQALELIEREERVEFLVQELKRWATEGSEQRYGHTEARHASSLPSDLRHPIDLGAFAGGDGQEVARNAPLHHRHRYHHHQHARSDLPFGGGRNNGLDLERSAGAAPLQQRTTEEIRRTSTLEATTQAGKQPSSSSFMQSWFTPAPRVSSSASSRTRSRTRRGASCLENENANKDTRPVLSLKAPLSLAATHPTRNRGSRNPVIVEPTRYVEEEDSDESESDPLRLGSIAGRLLGAMGRGILNVVVLLTMTGISQWVYSNFLEHRVEWIV
ncbi:hypothetical protein BGW41_005920 [Actinomortierella wolfii]|nr:hypothetical protein BGW41_005920 [Actinomortierella wolfii]